MAVPLWFLLGFAAWTLLARVIGVGPVERGRVRNQ